MKKILVIGASALQLPAIQKAKELGYYVGVVDYNPNAVGIPFADEAFDVSTIDIEGVVRVARTFGPDGIVTLATDMPVRAVAAACEALGLPGISPETALRATDKGEMIQAFEKQGVAHPWYAIVPDYASLKKNADQISFPCIVKPTDNAGSRGVVLCREKAELEEAYQYALGESRGGVVILEEYLEGPEFSVEVMVTDGKPHVLQITDKCTTGAPHFVEMGHSQPTRQPVAVQKEIRECAIRAVRAVGINVGPAHVELIYTKKGPVMVELGARLGGDFIATHLVPLSTGIDMVEMTIRLACGEKIDLSPKWERGSAIRYFKTPTGTLRKIDGMERANKIPGVREVTFVHAVGETVGEIGSSVDRIGFVIADAPTAREAESICQKAMDAITVFVE